MLTKLFVFITFFVFSHGAVKVASAEEMYAIVDRVEPPAGELTEISLGERIVSIETGEIRDCLVPKMEHTKSFLGAIYYIAANEPICKKTSSSRNFEPQYVNYSYGGTSSMMPVTFRQKKMAPTTYALDHLVLLVRVQRIWRKTTFSRALTLFTQTACHKRQSSSEGYLVTH